MRKQYHHLNKKSKYTQRDITLIPRNNDNHNTKYEGETTSLSKIMHNNPI